MINFKIFYLMFILIFFSCNKNSSIIDYDVKYKSQTTKSWYRDAVFYHIWVKSFSDSNNDGIGDINGITEKLDYLNKDLGITAIWLSPIFKCEQASDDPDYNMHGYDAVDFMQINEYFGNKDDLKNLLKEAHRRGVKVIFDFTPNHTSNKHPWFINSFQEKDKKEWYIWSENPSRKWGKAWGGGEWDDVWKRKNNKYYYSSFAVDSLADLNLNNRDVRKELDNILKYWMEFGFDGVRLDAVKYLFEEGPQKAANVDRNHHYLKHLREYIDSFSDSSDTYNSAKVTVGEVWDSESNIKTYYGNGDNELHMCFDFPYAYIVSKAVNGVDCDMVQYHWEEISEDYPADIKMATFLSNHDNVVSRPKTEYGDNKTRMIQAASLNILSPGVPFIYYGNEIGMEGKMGEDIDLRQFFEWGELKKLKKDKYSIFNWYKLFINIRNSYKAIREGKYIIIPTDNSKVKAHLRSLENESILIVNNYSNSSKDIILDFNEMSFNEKNISVLIGDDNTIKFKNNKLLIKNINTNCSRIYYIGKEKKNKVSCDFR